MSSYFTKPTALAKFVLARAADINTRIDAIETAFDNVEVAVLAIPVTIAASEAAAAASEALAAEWAEKAEDSAVTGYPGQYSALHHSAKASASASAASSSASAASSSASAASSSASAASASASAAAASAASVNADNQLSLVSEVTGTTQTAVAGTMYILTNVAATTVTLPASPSSGNRVGVCVGNDLTTNVVARNGNTIMGLSEDMTIDREDVTVIFVYDGSTWRIA